MAGEIAKLSSEYLIDESKIAAETALNAELNAGIHEASVVIPQTVDTAKLSSTEMKMLENNTILEAENSMIKTTTVEETLEHNSISKALKREQFKLLSAVNKNTIKLLDEINTNATSNAEIYETVQKAIKSDKKFSEHWFKTLHLAKTCKNVTIAGAVVASTYEAVKWITSYINENNGPRKIYANSKQVIVNERIISPYPCGFSNKNGSVLHPLNSYIISATNGNVCDNWTNYDPCGGWASLSHNSRIANLVSKDILKQFTSVRLECRQVALSEAIGALTYEVSKSVAETVEQSVEGMAKGFLNFHHIKVQIIGIFSLIASVFVIRSKFNLWIKALAVLSIIVALIIYAYQMKYFQRSNGK